MIITTDLPSIEVIFVKERTTRLRQIIHYIENSAEPVTGTELANQFQVTRQVVVHDIALLRAQGVNLVSTPRGYMIANRKEHESQSLLAVCHRPDQTADELYTFVDFGISVLDVQVEHPVYGQITGSLQLASRRDVDLFMEKITKQKATLLSSLTDGYHLHTVQYVNDERLEEAIRALKEKEIQVFD